MVAEVDIKPKVYIETTIISYLTAWRSPQLVMAANQESHSRLVDEERHYFDLYISEAVVQEASGGDPSAVERRLEAIKGLPNLPITDDGRQLAKELITKTPLPTNAQLNAPHIAIATVNGMDYLLMWNCRHIANATLRGAMARICETQILNCRLFVHPRS